MSDGCRPLSAGESDVGRGHVSSDDHYLQDKDDAGIPRSTLANRCI